VSGVVSVGGFDSGVTVNARPALVSPGKFVALLTVDPSVTSLTARVTGASGPGTTDTIPISVDLNVDPQIRVFGATPDVGVAPLTANFMFTAAGTVTNVELDSEGDGHTDFTGQTLDGYTFLYSEPGTYLPALSITFADGSTAKAASVVQVYDTAQLDGMLQQRWTGMKTSLAAGDIDGALGSIVASKRDSYRQMFEALGSQITNIDQIFSNITFVKVSFGRAEYQMLEDHSTGGIRLSHFVLFVLDTDGVWRLKFF
jgi:hypothetical protein